MGKITKPGPRADPRGAGGALQQVPRSPPSLPATLSRARRLRPPSPGGVGGAPRSPRRCRCRCRCPDPLRSPVRGRSRSGAGRGAPPQRRRRRRRPRGRWRPLGPADILCGWGEAARRRVRKRCASIKMVLSVLNLTDRRLALSPTVCKRSAEIPRFVLGGLWYFKAWKSCPESPTKHRFHKTRLPQNTGGDFVGSDRGRNPKAQPPCSDAGLQAEGVSSAPSTSRSCSGPDSSFNKNTTRPPPQQTVCSYPF